MSTSDTTNESVLPVWAAIPLYILGSFLAGTIGILLGSLFHFPEVDANYTALLKMLPETLSLLAGAWLCAILFLRVFDGRPVSDLGMSIQGRWKDCLAGIGFAAVLYAIGFGCSLLLGAVQIAGVQFNPGILAASFGFFLIAATVEEILIRGYILGKFLSTGMNKFAALGVSSIIFSALHLFNPNIGLLPLLNLWLAGLLLGASYIYTRNLWFPILLHAGWNWIQGPVLGYEVSGQQLCPSALQLYLPNENILNGGKFGFEGSLICSILCVLGTLAIVYWYERRKQ